MHSSLKHNELPLCVKFVIHINLAWPLSGVMTFSHLFTLCLIELQGLYRFLSVVIIQHFEGKKSTRILLNLTLMLGTHTGQTSEAKRGEIQCSIMTAQPSSARCDESNVVDLIGRCRRISLLIA